MAKGGYLSWNPLNWFKSAPAPEEQALEQAPVEQQQQPVGGPYGGRRRKTRKVRKTKRSRTGKKSNRS